MDDRPAAAAPDRPPEPVSVWQPGAEIPQPPWLERLVDLVRGPVGPYVSAELLALLSLPVVLLNVKAFATKYTDYQDLPLAPTDPSVVSAGLLAVLLAGILASVVGVPVARRHAFVGWLVTVLVAWATAIITIPFGPTIAGLPYATAQVCFDGCMAWIVAPGTGLGALAYGWWMSPLYAPLTFVTLLAGAGLWAFLVHSAAPPAPDPSP